MQFLKSLSTISITLFMSVFAVNASAANITRQCEAGMSVKHPSGQSVAVELFNSKAGCGKSVPNRCRTRARDKAHRCMSAHWKTRWDRKRPTECNDAGILDYDTRDLKWKLEVKACKQGWGKNSEKKVSLVSWTKGNSKCSRTETLTDKYILTPAMCATALNSSPPPRRTPPPPAITIPGNDKMDNVTGLRFPSSMPKIRFPKGYKGCSANEKKSIKKWWAMGHYMTWIADQYMDWMEKHDKYRAKAWNHHYRKASLSNDWVNYAPRGWFGGYSKKNFDIADGTIERLWKKRFIEKTFTVKCRTNDNNRGAHPCYRNNPGGSGKPSANHIALGIINFCNNAFTSENEYLGGRRVVHELLHWLRTPTGMIVQDTHTHCHGVGKCTTDKGYGRAKSSHLASYEGGSGSKNAKKRRRVKHRAKALRNNDNYAWFIYYIGSMAHKKTNAFSLPKVTQLPPKPFDW